MVLIERSTTPAATVFSGQSLLMPQYSRILCFSAQRYRSTRPFAIANSSRIRRRRVGIDIWARNVSHGHLAMTIGTHLSLSSKLIRSTQAYSASI